jgi:hypothetical protein
MERDRGRGIRALSVDKDWCGTDTGGGAVEDWCGKDTGDSAADVKARGDWCGTERQSPEPDEIAALLAQLSPRRRRS